MENDFELIDFSQLQEFITKNKINNITKLRKLNNNYYFHRREASTVFAH